MSDRYRPPTGPKATRTPEPRKRPEKSPYNGKHTPSGNSNKFKPFNQRDANDRFVPTGPRRDNYRPRPDAPPAAPRPPSGPAGRSDRSLPPKRPYNDTRDLDDTAQQNNKGYRPKPPYKSDPKRPKFNPSKGPKPFEKRKPAFKLTADQIYSVRTTRATEIYNRVLQVGEGTYGKVYKAKNEVTEDYVALKKLRLETEREGFPITALREIKLLQSFDHPNIISLLEMMVEQNQIYMVFDYMDHDLTGLLSHPGFKLEESHRKFIFKQLMEGIKYLHDRRVIHRDIKGSNILLDSIGRLKIADFGLARTMKIVKDGESPDYTNRVITIWYRPPELLLGSTDYGREVDIWGVGCLLIELYSRMATFQGFDEVGQLHKIFNIMGTPTLEEWPEIQNLPWFEMLKPKVNKVNVFAETFREQMSEHGFDLALNLLHLNPKKRLTAAEALKHDFFLQEPAPEPLLFLKEMKGEWHEFETKKRRRRERKRIQEEKERQKAEGHETGPDTAPERPNNGTSGVDTESMTVDSVQAETAVDDASGQLPETALT